MEVHRNVTSSVKIQQEAVDYGYGAKAKQNNIREVKKYTKLQEMLVIAKYGKWQDNF